MEDLKFLDRGYAFLWEFLVEKRNADKDSVEFFVVLLKERGIKEVLILLEGVVVEEEFDYVEFYVIHIIILLYIIYTP